MMAPLAGAIVVYSVQIAAVVAVAAGAARLLREALPSARLAYWRVVGLLCLALPLVGPSGAALPGASAGVVLSGMPLAGAAAERVEPLLDPFAPILVWVYASGVAVRLAWLLAGAIGLGRIRRRATPAALDASIETLRRSIAPRAEFRWSGEVGQPVACGLVRPFVLLPRRFASLCSDAQRAVAHHELLHVRRRDWAWILVEEHLRAAFWFHPAAWCVLEQVQLSREQSIDREVVTSSRASKRPYMNALLAFADGGRLAAPSMAFLRRRHLEARLQELSKEAGMSRNRLILTMAALLLAAGGTAAGAARALPLDVSRLSLQAASSSPLEIRLAENTPGDGLVRAEMTAGDRFCPAHAGSGAPAPGSVIHVSTGHGGTEARRHGDLVLSGWSLRTPGLRISVFLGSG